MNGIEDTRENWGSRMGFVLAAIGSAVGLGNVWRFPHEAYSNGGSAFLIPYIVAIIVIGFPLLIMEFSLGHLTQQAAPNAFKRVGARWEFVGWWPILLSFVIVCYYAVVLAWCLNYLIFSFSNPLCWAADSEKFFFNSYLQLSEGYKLAGLRWPVVAALGGIWLAMYLCIFRGVKLVGKIVLWTVPIPWLMLIILTVRGLTLEGAMQGLEYYLEPDWSVLKNPAVWRAAFGQVFFSCTIAFGVMITYASFLHRKSDLNNNALIVCLADLATSFIAGIAVFATMGALALKTGQPVHEVLEGSESVGLAFVAFPKALAELPLANVFSVIFFIALLLLGIDSAFSITEATLASMIDKTAWTRTFILIIMSLVGFSVGLLFTTRGGINWLATVDGFVNEGTWGIMFVGLVECLVLGWAFNIGRLRQHANKNSDWQLGRWWEWTIRLVAPGILAALVVWSLIGDIKGPSLTLTLDDLKDSKALTFKLQNPNTPLSGFLHSRLAPETKRMLGQYTPMDQPDEPLQQALVADLNQVLQGPCLYDETRFANVKLTPATKTMLTQPAEDTDDLRLNRWLLQDAYPDQIVESTNVGGFFVDFQGQLIGKNVLGMCLTFIIFLFAVMLSLWRPRKPDQPVMSAS